MKKWPQKIKKLVTSSGFASYLSAVLYKCFSNYGIIVAAKHIHPHPSGMLDAAFQSGVADSFSHLDVWSQFIWHFLKSAAQFHTNYYTIIIKKYICLRIDYTHKSKKSTLVYLKGVGTEHIHSFQHKLHNIRIWSQQFEWDYCLRDSRRHRQVEQSAPSDICNQISAAPDKVFLSIHALTKYNPTLLFTVFQQNSINIIFHRDMEACWKTKLPDGSRVPYQINSRQKNTASILCIKPNHKTIVSVCVSKKRVKDETQIGKKEKRVKSYEDESVS